MLRTSGNHLQDDLNQLAQSRALLTSAIDIVRYMERIQRSLESIAVMGHDAHQIPEDARRFFFNLSDKIKSMPAEKLLAYLTKLDELIRTDLDRIIAVADGAVTPDLLDDATAMFGLDEESVKQLINEFERRTRTSVSLRVLLIRRGVEVDVLVIPIAEDSLQARIQSLDDKEKECTGVIQDEIVSMQDDIDLILNHHKCSEALQEQLAGVRNDLQQNLDHIRAGKSIDELPHPFEVAEGSDTNTWVTPPAASPVEPEPEKPDPAPTNQHKPVETDPSRGLFSTLWTYLTTPNHVTWERAKTWQKPKA